MKIRQPPAVRRPLRVPGSQLARDEARGGRGAAYRVLDCALDRMRHRLSTGIAAIVNNALMPIGLLVIGPMFREEPGPKDVVQVAGPPET